MSSNEPDYKTIVLEQRKKSLEYYHKHKNVESMKIRNERQRQFYNEQKEYYKIYNRYRRAKKINKLEEFINKTPEDYNYLINSGRVRALKNQPLILVPQQTQSSESSEE